MAKNIERRIYEGIETGDVTLVRQLLTEHPQLNKQGEDWLASAAYHGHIDLADMLLSNGIRPQLR